jgi:tetratricopeptide (TPR) repeat protein
MSDQEERGRRLFISYSRQNKAQVYPFVEALISAGIKVWIDREEIDPFDDFPERIRDGLAQCHALLAWYSPEYAQSSYCQKELTAAWICAQRLSRNAMSRLRVVNPEANVRHIALGDIGSQNYLAVPTDQTSQAICIRSIQERLATLSGGLATVREFKFPEWYPSAQQGSARFVGRLREFWKIHTALNPVGISEHENANVVAQLQGLGGVGKSLLAIEYAKRFSAAYPGGIHWLRAYGFDPNKPMGAEARERECRTQVENIALGYGISIRDKNPQEIRRDLALKLASGAQYLWVVDDLPPGLNPQEAAFLHWCAPSATGCTLITTRSKDYDGIGSMITVDVLDPEPALELLTHERKPQTDREREDAKGLVEDLGRHALALDVAGHFLLKTRGFATLRREVTQEGNGNDPLGVLAAGLKGQLPGGHEKSIVATLVKSVGSLEEQGCNLLRLACELNVGTPIPLRLAKEVFEYAFELDAQESEDYLSQAVNQSEAHSLAAASLGGVGNDAVSIHSLVRYTMLRADPLQEVAPLLREQLHEAAVVALADILRDASDIRKHISLQNEIAHARYVVPQLRTADEAMLFRRLARFEGQRGNYREALGIDKRVLEIQMQILGRDDPETLRTRNNVAAWTGQSGDARQALRLFWELLPDLERVRGLDHPDTLTIRNQIAGWTGHAGESGRALQLFQELLPCQERVRGLDHPDTLRTRSNIAHWIGKTGQGREALRLFQELLPDWVRVLGPDHPETLTTRSNIAAWMGQTGAAREALGLFRELFQDRERVLGPNHPGTLTTRNDIAVWAGQTGEKREALRLFRELLPDQDRVLGPDHPETLRTRNNIAACAASTGEVLEALRLFRELLPDQDRVLGPEHPDTLTTRGHIAHWTGESGDAREALRLFRELLPDLERVLGLGHPNTLRIRNNMALLTAQAGDLRKALCLLQRLLPEQELVMGPDHQDTVTTRNNIASLEAEQAYAPGRHTKSPPT